MLFPPPQVIFGLLLLSIAVVLIWDIRYNPFGENYEMPEYLRVSIGTEAENTAFIAALKTVLS